MASIEDIKSILNAKVKDDQFELQDEPYVASALKEFEDDVPNIAKDDTTVSSAAKEFDLPSDFDIGYGYSGIVSIEYPIMESTDSQPTFAFVNGQWTEKEINRYGMHLYSPNGTTVKLRFRSNLNQNFRLAYRKKYTVDENGSDLPTHFNEIVATLAASYKAKAVAAKLMQKKDYTRAEDFVNLNFGPNDFLRLATELRQEYARRVEPYLLFIIPQTVEVTQTFGRIART